MDRELARKDPEGLAELVSDILRDGQKLMQQEVLLLRTEVQQEWTKAKTVALVFLLGVIAACAAFFAAILCFIFVLNALGVPLWAGFGIFSLGTAAGGFVLLRRSQQLGKEVMFVPRQTVASVKENVTWFKKRT